jgi:hypothetical protein
LFNALTIGPCCSWIARQIIGFSEYFVMNMDARNTLSIALTKFMYFKLENLKMLIGVCAMTALSGCVFATARCINTRFGPKRYRYNADLGGAKQRRTSKDGDAGRGL